MMRTLLLLLVALLALALAPLLLGDKGYVLIAFGDTTVEMTLVSLGVMVLAAVLIALPLRWLLGGGWRQLQHWRHWFSGRRSQQQQKALTRGLVALDEANYAEAKKQLDKLDSAASSGVELLAAAQAALQLGESQKARDYWQQAEQKPATRLAASLHLLEADLQDNKLTQAQQRIDALAEKDRKHPRVVQLWLSLLARRGDWQALQDKLPGWKKQLSEQDYQYWSQQAATGSYAELASKEGANPLKQFWQALPRSTRKDPAQQFAFVQQLIGQGMHQDAEAYLCEFQKKQPQPQLLPLFKDLQLPNPAQALRRLEGWIKADPENSELFSVLGHLAFNAKDWELAEKALSKTVKLAATPADMRLLAQVKERQAKQEDALLLYKQSLELSRP